MKQELYDFDIYPKVFLEGREQTVTVQPLGEHASAKLGTVCAVEIRKADRDIYELFPEVSGRQVLQCPVSEDGCLRFTARFDGEGEYLIWIANAEKPDQKTKLSVYALADDMAGRFPYRGDLHVHSCRSDGREGPNTVVANYRGHGYDFMAVTDHHIYDPSLEVMQTWKGITDLTLVPGEEVHPPLHGVHYVNFGGSYSINALVIQDYNREICANIKLRSADGNAPEPMSMEAYEAMIRQRAESVPLEHESQRISFAVLQWIYEHMQKNGGLGIFPHPYWRCPVAYIPEDYIRFIYEQKPFDAFEVLGGVTNYYENGYQTALYHEMRGKGYDYPVVGSTDTHGSTEHNAGALSSSTIVFARENSREGLISAIKEKYSLAVDTISKEYRLVGDFRMVKYGCFLMDHYFPLHDLACKAEGYYMNRLLAGDSRAATILAAMKGQIPEMIKKYFAL